MSTKIGRMHRRLNDEFRDELTDAVRGKFGLEVEHYFDLLGTGRLVTTRTDGEAFTPEQHAFIGAYSEGFAAAMAIVGSER
jgi:hypothetical protein